MWSLMSLGLGHLRSCSPCTSSWLLWQRKPTQISSPSQHWNGGGGLHSFIPKQTQWTVALPLGVSAFRLQITKADSRRAPRRGFWNQASNLAHFEGWPNVPNYWGLTTEVLKPTCIVRSVTLISPPLLPRTATFAEMKNKTKPTCFVYKNLLSATCHLPPATYTKCNSLLRWKSHRDMAKSKIHLNTQEHATVYMGHTAELQVYREFK